METTEIWKDSNGRAIPDYARPGDTYDCADEEMRKFHAAKSREKEFADRVLGTPVELPQVAQAWVAKRLANEITLARYMEAMRGIGYNNARAYKLLLDSKVAVIKGGK